MINTIWGATTKPIASKRLAALLEEREDLDATLYIGYPIIGTPEGAFPFDALLLSKEKGIVAFHIVEGKELGEFGQILDDSFTKLQAKLLQYSPLVKKRVLGVEINTIAFAPAIGSSPVTNDSSRIVATSNTLLEILDSISWENKELYPALAAAIQAVSTIRKGKKRKETKNQDSRGARMKRVDDSIANLDSQQSAAVIETVEGVQRIRGLAGSGKTIVLALKVAYLHARYPEWKIAVTFNTRSLKGQFERLITTFVIEQTNEEPDWDRIEIINAWGAPGGKSRDGMYFKFCVENGLPYLDFRSADSQFGSKKAFAGVCDLALSAVKKSRQLFDAILVDEAQDFAPSFLRLCYEFLKEPRRLIYAYDELQSLTDNSLPSPEEIFGVRKDGQPRVTFSQFGVGNPRQDIILEKCYRNSRPLLATAHALGFGIYRRPEGLIQLFEQKELWLDVGYRVVSGELKDDHFVALGRNEETSPKFLESHSAIDDLITFKAFDSMEEQSAWLVSAIRKNIEEEELDPEDVIVINPNPLKTRNAVSKARALLMEENINSSLAGVTNSADIFFESNSVTFTGIFRAKGNEAPMVYVINAQDCHSAFLPGDLARARNQLFTAITRSKGWVRVLGVGKAMESLISEFSRVKERNFRLEFVYPNEERRKSLQIINRDMTKAERERLKKGLVGASRFIQSVEDGEVDVDDLSPEMLEKLNKILLRTKRK